MRFGGEHEMDDAWLLNSMDEWCKYVSRIISGSEGTLTCRPHQ